LVWSQSLTRTLPETATPRCVLAASSTASIWRSAVPIAADTVAVSVLGGATGSPSTAPIRV